MTRVSPTIEGLEKFECSKVGKKQGGMGLAIKYFVNRSTYSVRVRMGSESRDVKLINKDVLVVDLPAGHSEAFWFGYSMQSAKSGLSGWLGNHKLEFI